MSMSETRPSEELGAINDGHTMAGLKVLPIFRKTGPTLLGADAFLRARDIERLMDSLPQILAVVGAAEAEYENSQLVNDEAILLGRALSALKKALHRPAR